jgi:hypothetical protein
MPLLPFRFPGELVRTALALLLPLFGPPLLLFAVLLLAGCGGGSSDAGKVPVAVPPTITSFSAAAPGHYVGDRAQLTAVFAGGSGRIVDEGGATLASVSSGAAFTTAPLSMPVRFTLIVEGGGQVLRRELLLEVAYRDRYVTLAQPRALQYHAAVATGDGGVLVIGGSRGENTLSTAIDRFDPVLRSFTRVGSLRTGRAGHTLSLIHI